MPIPTKSLLLHGTRWDEPGPQGLNARGRNDLGRDEQFCEIMDIFEGTEQIQQLVVARALSGLRIE